jgi:hypothetical protein
VTSAIGSILDRTREVPSDTVFSRVVVDAFEHMGKKTNSFITKTEFISWASHSIKGSANSLEGIFHILVNGLGGEESHDS